MSMMPKIFNWQPITAAPINALNCRVSIHSAGGGKCKPRLEISFSRQLGEQFGITVKEDQLPAVMIFADRGFVFVCPGDVGGRIARGTKALRVTTRRMNSTSSLRVHSPLPPACVLEVHPATSPAAFEVRDGGLIVKLPDSFLRPEYLEPQSCMPESSTAGYSSADQQVCQACEIDDTHGFTVTGQNAEAQTQPAAPAANNTAAPAYTTQRDDLFHALLIIAKRGDVCPDNEGLGKASGMRTSSVAPALSVLKGEKKVIVETFDAEGNPASKLLQGGYRIVSVCADDGKTYATVHPDRVVKAAFSFLQQKKAGIERDGDGFLMGSKPLTANDVVEKAQRLRKLENRSIG